MRIASEPYLLGLQVSHTIMDQMRCHTYVDYVLWHGYVGHGCYSYVDYEWCQTNEDRIQFLT